MRLPIYFFKGDPDKPSVVFIHGAGMDATEWLSPSETRIFAGAFPLSLLARTPPESLLFKKKPSVLPEKFSLGNTSPLNTSFNDLKEKGYTVITWSQRKPLGSIKYALDELKYVVQFANFLSDRGVILIGHSRGGLIGRKFVENNDEKIKAVITIATPHKGSSMAKWVKNISVISNLLKPFMRIFPEKAEKITNKLIDFLNCEAVKELMPDCPFIKSLKKIESENFFFIAGSNPTLFNIYKWTHKKENDYFIFYPEKIFSFPQSLISLLPEKLVPFEWKHGDGLVSVESAMDYGNLGKIFVLNHAEIIVNAESRNYILNIIENL